VRSRVYRSKAVDRALQTLQVIGDHPQGMTLASLGRETGIPLSSLLSILGSLGDRSVVRELPDKRYALDVGILHLSLPYAEGINASAVFGEVAAELVGTFNETVQLGILTGSEVVYVARRESTEPVRLVGRVGRRVPAHASAAGKALLSILEPEELRRVLGPEPLLALTPHTLVTYKDLERDLNKVRRSGIAEAQEECTPGLHCVAARTDALPGLPSVAVVISTPVFRMTPSKRSLMTASLKAGVSQLAESSFAAPRIA
jgi:DNA-binding IclR family transcriptional regulator